MNGGTDKTYKRNIHRLVIPYKFRKTLSLYDGSFLEITLEYGKLILTPFYLSCEDISTIPYVGIIHPIDAAGRIGIPVEYLDFGGFDSSTKYDISLSEGRIIISKPED